jgi:hypothetical protein
MGLPGSQRRILESIENGLRGSDPRLAELAWRLAALRRWFLPPRRTRLRTALFFPVALGLVVAVALVGSSFPDNTRCTPAAQINRVAHTSGRAKRTRLTCSPTATNPVIMAR